MKSIKKRQLLQKVVASSFCPIRRVSESKFVNKKEKNLKKIEMKNI